MKNKSKKVIKTVLRVSFSVIAVVAAFALFSEICNHPSEKIENTVSSYYREEAGTLDVVCIGSSAAWKDFLPPVLWQESGITSYCYAIGACSANVYKSVLTEAISTQPGAVILVDADGFLVDDKLQTEKDPIRLWLDSMPKNENHLNSIKELDNENRLEHYFPFIRYHRNMTSILTYVPTTVRLLKKQLANQTDPLKGATLNTEIKVKAMGLINSAEVTESTELTELSQKILLDFLEFCKQQGLTNVVFVNLPKSYYDDESRSRNLDYCARFNSLSKTAQSYGFKTLDCNSYGFVSGLTAGDFADSLHLTTDGAVRFSAALSQYIDSQCAFAEKSASVSEKWNSDYGEAAKILGLSS